MAQLYFKYGAMGSSKTANALMTRFNYEERGQKTLSLILYFRAYSCKYLFTFTCSG